MSFLASILVAFALGFTGHAATAPEQPVTAPVSVQQVTEVPTVLEVDAEATLDDYGVERIVTVDGIKMIVSYVETDGSSDSKPGEFTYESIDFPGEFHHYTFDRLRDA